MTCYCSAAPINGIGLLFQSDTHGLSVRDRGLLQHLLVGNIPGVFYGRRFGYDWEGVGEGFLASGGEHHVGTVYFAQRNL